MFRKFFGLSLFFISLFCIPLSVQAKELQFCYNDWPPYVSTQDGSAVGITVDVLKEAASRAGYGVSFRELPWNRCLEMVRQGELDGVLDAAEREEFLQGPASYSAYTNTFWVHENSVLDRFDMSTLSGKTVGLVDGYHYPEDLMDALQQENIAIEYAPDDKTNIRKLAFGRVTAIVADYANTLTIKLAHLLEIRPLSPTHSSDRLYPSLNSSLVAEQKALDAAVQSMLDEGRIEEVYRVHLGIGFADLGAD